MLFSKKTAQKSAQENKTEVAVARNAVKRAVQNSKKDNDHLKNLLDENGFTIKIYIAAGGHAAKHKP